MGWLFHKPLKQIGGDSPKQHTPKTGAFLPDFSPPSGRVSVFSILSNIQLYHRRVMILVELSPEKTSGKPAKTWKKRVRKNQRTMEKQTKRILSMFFFQICVIVSCQKLQRFQKDKLKTCATFKVGQVPKSEVFPPAPWDLQQIRPQTNSKA